MNERRENKSGGDKSQHDNLDMFGHGMGNLPIVGIVGWLNKDQNISRNNMNN